MNILHVLEQLATWQSPVSFLAGIGAHHLYCKYWRDRKDDDAREAC